MHRDPVRIAYLHSGGLAGVAQRLDEGCADCPDEAYLLFRRIEATLARLFDIITALPAESGGRVKVVPRGAVLLEQGSASDEMFFVLAGHFTATVGTTVVGFIEAGSVIGELGFFTGQPRSASVTAFRDAVVIAVNRAEYERMATVHPELRDAVASELAARVAGMNAGLKESGVKRPLPRAIALLPVGGAEPVLAVMDRLAACLAAIRPVRVMRRAELPDAVARQGLDTTEAIRWFTEAERDARLVIYVPEDGDEAWNRAILRQSDHAVFVAEAGVPPAPSPLERYAAEILPRADRSLLLVHPRRAARVDGTARWRETRRVGRHHHVCLSDDADLARVARWLTGTAVGLVLSGGGALGPAQTGVWSVLQKAGMGADCITGTSVGAAMGAAFTLGLGRDEIAERTEEMFVKGKVMRRPTLPRYALLDHKEFDRLIHMHYGEHDIRDLWMPFAAVASNLSSRSLEVMDEGPLWEAVRASASIPGVLPPFVRSDGQVLVDGGPMCNLPVEPMRQMKTGPNVVIALQPGHVPPQEGRVDFPGRWELLKSLLRPGMVRSFPEGLTASNTVMQSMIVGQASRRPSVRADELLFQPQPPEGYTLMSWTRHRELLELAEEQAREWLATTTRDLTPFMIGPAPDLPR